MGLKKLWKMRPPLRTAYLLRKFGILKYLDIQLESVFSEKKYIVPLMNNIGYRNLRYNTEPWMKELIAVFLKNKEGVFLDVGANIGQTLMKVRSVSSVPYIGFEPNPESFVYLERLIKVNRLKDCTVCPVGLSDKNSVLTLYSSFEGSPYATVVEGYNAHHGVKKARFVPVFRGDELIPTIFPVEKIAIIKIDVEGAELDVMEGMAELLKSYRPFVIIEIVPVENSDAPYAQERQSRIDQLIALVKGNNYSVFRIEKTEKTSFVPIERIKVGESFHISYAFVPVEAEKEVISDL